MAKATKTFPPNLLVIKYGQGWIPLQAGGRWIPCPNWYIELQILQTPEGGKFPKGYKGFKFHFMELVTCLLGNPDGIYGFQWNPNAVRILDGIIDYRFLGLCGCASSGKSKSLAGIALCWWLIQPFTTKILVTSTTIKTAKGKIWGDISEAWNAACAEVHNSSGGTMTLPGRLLGSTQQIRYEYGTVKSDKAGIELIPTDANKQKEASEKMQGYKRGNVILLGDEWDTLPPMLLKTARSNLFSNPDFRLWGAFNPTGRFTNGGQFSKPKDGWESINEDSDGWETETGYCIRFDGLKSPNVKAHKEVWTGLFTDAKLAQYKLELGEESSGFFTMVRGFFPPTGDANALYSEAELVSQYLANKTVEQTGGGWEHSPDWLAGLDPAWTHGGDRAVLSIAKCGMAQFKTPEGRESRRVFELVRTIVLDNEITDKTTDKTEQIIRLTKKYLEQYKIPSRHLAVDVTGAAPFVTLLNRDVGSDFIHVMFSEKPSKIPVSKTDKRLSCDVYRNIMSEIWCVGKALVRGGQIRGLNDDVMEEMCSRTFKEGNGKGTLTEVQPKAQMKSTGHKSPDKADSLFVCLFAARSRCGLSGNEKSMPKPVEQYERKGIFTQIYGNLGLIKKPPVKAGFEVEKTFAAGGWGDD